MSNGEADDDVTGRRPTEPSAAEAPSARPAEEALPRTLKGRFVLEQRIGDGGMGSVYKALDRNRKTHNDPQPYVALKILKGALLREYPDAVLALQREASRTLKLSHHNIVRVYDFDTDGDAYFITMELLQGESLVAMLNERPRGLPLSHVLFLLEQLCAGLAYAHDQGIVHSDLKPSNIFVTTGSVLKILDFGIASPLRRLGAGGAPTLYDPRKLRALTPSHASPEQWQQMPADPRDDVYSLGCIVYELLCGRHPFAETNAMLAQKSEMEVHPIPSLSRQQNAALRKALQFKREDRTPSAEQLYQELRQPVAPGDPRRRWIALSSAGAIAATVAVAWLIFDRMKPEVGSVQAPEGTAQALPTAAGGSQTTGGAPPATVSPPEPAGQQTPAIPVDTNGYMDCRGLDPKLNLDLAISEGLDAQTQITLAGEGSAGDDACGRARAVLECLQIFRDGGAESRESQALRADLATSLSACEPAKAAAQVGGADQG